RQGSQEGEHRAGHPHHDGLPEQADRRILRAPRQMRHARTPRPLPPLEDGRARQASDGRRVLTLAYYAEKDFFEDEQLIELVNGILQGNLTLEWYRVETPKLRAKPANPDRGLTYEDCNIGPYGYDAIPEFLRNRYSMASRGSALVAKLPDLGYT